MSLVIASTTDTQEAVDQAAGISSSAPKTPESPSATPPETTEGELEIAEESEPPEDTPEQEEHQKKASNVQRRIDRLTRERYQLAGRVQELERRLTESPRPGPQPSPQAPPQPANMPGRPQESQFESYEQYIDALTDWKAAQTAVQAYNHFRQQEEQRRAQEAARAQQEAWMERVHSMRSKAPDFDETLAAAEDVQLPPVLQAAILEHEHGPRLAYELAKQPEVLSKLASLPPVAALRELGKFESKLDLNGEQRRPSAVSKAPPPISPVGQGSTRSTKSSDEMSQEEYRRWRIKGGAWWGRNAQGR
jgi:hypothetical protein